ncbi:MAG: hypothetical protein M1834_003898 [Cirrosporium novae-zelandiae]|nr:MAG: hypothetical protein M1834_003898 [Cirrosporium novae-zelandiae]
MGNDGGSIPTRRELVKESARPLSTSEAKEKKLELLAYAWSQCSLSHKPLAAPVVSDSSGVLYNKDAVLQFLLPGDDNEMAISKEDCEKVLMGRVKGLRDIVEVKFEVAGAGDEDSKKDDTSEERGQRWVCPVTGKILGAHVKAVYLVPCGHAFSEAALKEMESETCLQCNEPYRPENIIPILPTTEEEKDRLKKRIEKLTEEGLTHSLKKAPTSKKRKKNRSESKNAIIASTTGSTTATQSKGTTTTTDPTNSNHTSSSIKDAATASLTRKVMEEQEERNKRRKLGRNQNIQSLFMSDKERAAEAKLKGSDFMSRGFSIPNQN